MLMFSQKLCGKCKAYERELIERDIQFRKVDITNDEKMKQHIRDLGIRQMPVFAYNSKYYTNFEEVVEKIEKDFQE